MVNVGPLTARSVREFGAPQQLSMGFASSLPYCNDVARWRSTKLHDVWPSLGLVHYIYICGPLSPNGILPGAKFILHPSLAFSYIGSVTARHSSSGRHPNFEAWYKEWNYRTFVVGATYIRLGGHHVWHRPTHILVKSAFLSFCLFSYTMLPTGVCSRLVIRLKYRILM